MAAILEPPLEQAETETLEQQPVPRLFTVAEYHRMIEAGVFNEDGRIELLDGRIVKMTPKSVRHAAVNEDASDFFKRLLKKRAVVRSQNPVVLDDSSEPEPDIVVARPPKTKYYKHHPTPQDIILVMEIADSSLDHDRRKKSLAYAQSGIVQYLVLNLKTSELIDFREPSPEGYRSYKTLRADEALSLVTFPEVRIQVSELLPPPE